MIRTILTLALVPVLAHAPIPWVHDHAQVSPESLAVHLRCCHTDCPGDELPQGTHFHFSPLEALAGNTDDQNSPTPAVAARWTDRDSDEVLQTPSAFPPTTAFTPAGSPAPPDYSSSGNRFASACELFQLYGALRI